MAISSRLVNLLHGADTKRAEVKMKPKKNHGLIVSKKAKLLKKPKAWESIKRLVTGKW